MTALQIAERALGRVPADPGVPVTITGAEAAAVRDELARLRRIEAAARAVVDGTTPAVNGTARVGRKLFAALVEAVRATP